MALVRLSFFRCEIKLYFPLARDWASGSAAAEFNQVTLTMKMNSSSDSFPACQVKYRCSSFIFPFKDFLGIGATSPVCVVLSVGMTLYFAKLLVGDTQFLRMQLSAAACWKTGQAPELRSGLCDWNYDSSLHHFFLNCYTCCADRQRRRLPNGDCVATAAVGRKAVL